MFLVSDLKALLKPSKLVHPGGYIEDDDTGSSYHRESHHGCEPEDNSQEDFNNENHLGDENEDGIQEEEEEETPYQLPLELSAH